MLQPDSGSIILDGKDISNLSVWQRAAQELGIFKLRQCCLVLALENVATAVQAKVGSSFKFFARAADEAH